MTEEVAYEGEKDQGAEKPSVEEGATDINKENPDNEAEEKEPEAKVNVSHYLVRWIFNPKSYFLMLGFSSICQKTWTLSKLIA